jgi:epoxyqueuosine reductase
MTEDEFREKFKGSPVKRAKWRGLMRNVAAALSSSEDPAAEVALLEALSHPEEVVRAQAELSLRAIRNMRTCKS